MNDKIQFAAVINTVKTLSQPGNAFTQFLAFFARFSHSALHNFNIKLIKLPCKKTTMEKRVLGIILSLLGVAGIVYAAISFVNGGTGTANIKIIAAFGIVGAIFFFAGIGLVRNTKDKPT